jgi:hypothetical protein
MTSNFNVWTVYKTITYITLAGYLSYRLFSLMFSHT